MKERIEIRELKNWKLLVIELHGSNVPSEDIRSNKVEYYTWKLIEKTIEKNNNIEKLNRKALIIMHVIGVLFLYLLNIILTGSFKI